MQSSLVSRDQQYELSLNISPEKYGVQSHGFPVGLLSEDPRRDRVGAASTKKGQMPHSSRTKLRFGRMDSLTFHHHLLLRTQKRKMSCALLKSLEKFASWKKELGQIVGASIFDFLISESLADLAPDHEGLTLQLSSISLLSYLTEPIITNLNFLFL